MMKKPIKLYIKKVIKTILILYVILSICGTARFVDHLLAGNYDSISQYVSLDDSWDISFNEEDYRNVSLDQISFERTRIGDVITMRRVLPAHFGLAEGALRLRINQTAVRMYIDGEQVYEYGHDRIEHNKTVGSGFLFINFPNEYQGKPLEIQLTVSEDKAFTKLNSLRIYEWENAYRVLLTENRIPLFIGCFLTIFGVIICCITVFAYIVSRKFLRVLCISLFSICLGLWTLCYYNVILAFSLPLYTAGLLEYLTLYLGPIPLIIYMREDVDTLKQGYMKALYRILLTVQIAATATMIGLHAVDVVHCTSTLKYMQMLIVCNLIYFIIVEIMNLRTSRQLNHRLFLVGMLIVSVSIAYDLLGYYIKRYYGLTSLSVKGVASFGLTVFIFILLISFYLDVTKKMMQEKERDFLIKSAYTDELTQIHNRRYCMEYMNRIREAEELHYTVFCFDLNNLKTTNDTYGHAKGDILIRSAAKVIADSFENLGIVARMGGDEFIAIVETDDDQTISSLLHDFHANIDEQNHKIPDLNMSIAYGYASSSAKESSIEKVYQIADNNMYENKQQMKLTRPR